MMKFKAELFDQNQLKKYVLIQEKRSNKKVKIFKHNKSLKNN